MRFQDRVAIITGAVELMVTDVQCCMASLPNVARCYHTKILTSTPIAMNIELYGFGGGLINNRTLISKQNTAATCTMPAINRNNENSPNISFRCIFLS